MNNFEKLAKKMQACEGMSPSQRLAFLESLTVYNILIVSGFGGAGKTWLTQKIQKEHEDLGWLVKVTATTGVASTQYPAGMTTSSLFGLGPMNVIADGLCDSGTQHNTRREIPSVYNSSVLAGLKCRKLLVVIDEVSMASAQMLVVCIQILEHMKAKRPGFEYKVIFVGDARQLEAVPSKNTPWPNFCDSFIEPARFQEAGSDEIHYYQTPLFGYPNELKNGVPVRKLPWVVKNIALLENHRVNKEELYFTEWLRKLGEGDAGEYPFNPYAFKFENGNYVPVKPWNTSQTYTSKDVEDALHVYSTNKACKEENDRVFKLKQALNPNMKILVYKAKIKYNGKYPLGESAFKNSALGAIPEVQTLYEGASFMVRMNIPDSRLRNGTLCTIIQLKPNSIKLEGISADGTKFTEWLSPQEMICPTDDKTGLPHGTVTCIPGHIADALTPWKCQGLTWRKKLIYHLDVNWYKPKHGLSYVVCSRVTKGSDLIVLIPSKKGVQVYCNPKYKAWIKTLEEQTIKQLMETAMNHSPSFLVEYQDWKAQIKITAGNMVYQLDYQLGHLVESKAVTSSSQRDLYPEEVTFVTKIVESHGIQLLSNEAVKLLVKWALLPVLKWGNKKLLQLGNLTVNTGVRRKLEIDFPTQTETYQKCLLFVNSLYGGATEDYEYALETLFNIDSTDDIPWGEYVGEDILDLGVIDKLCEIVANNYDELVYDHKFVLQLLEYSEALYKEEKVKAEAQDWYVAHNEGFASVNVEGFIVEEAKTTPVQAKPVVKAKTTPVQAKPVVKAKTTPVQDEYKEAITKLRSYASSKLAGLKRLKDDPDKIYPMLTVEGSKAFFVLYGLEDAFRSVSEINSGKLCEYLTSCEGLVNVNINNAKILEESMTLFIDLKDYVIQAAKALA